MEPSSRSRLKGAMDTTVQDGKRANRSLNLTAPRAEFSVRREYSQGSMLVVRKFCGDNTENVFITSVHNGRRRLAPNRYTVAFISCNVLLQVGAVLMG